jgi:polysaccharide export outer membrane protein
VKVHPSGLFVLCLSAAACLFAQTGGQQPEAPKPQSAKPVEAPPTKTPDESKPLPVDPKTFQIGAEDVLFIQVWREPDFTRQVIIRPDGKITMPLIGEVQASGLTPDQLNAQLAESLSKYLNNPQVSTTVIGVNSKKYYITGEINRPGSFPLVVPTRVLDALSNAGGFREFANTKKIFVLRKGQRLKFNYKDVIKGKHDDQNIFLENGDYIIVP